MVSQARRIFPVLAASTLLVASADAQLSQVPDGLHRSRRAPVPGTVIDPPKAPPSPFTTLVGLVVADDQSPVDGATVTTNSGFVAMTDVMGAFVILDHPTDLNFIDLDVEGVVTDTFGFQLNVPAKPGFVTDAGTIVVDVDTDTDGLPDWYETNIYSTLVLVPDTDGDTYTDGVEVLALGTDPTSGDGDGDGFPDVLELAIGTNPNSPDPSTTINGTLELPNGDPATAGTLHLLGVPETLFSATTDVNGFYQFPPWPVLLTPVQVVGEETDPFYGPAKGTSASTPTLIGGVTAIDDITMVATVQEPLYPDAQFVWASFGQGIPIGTVPMDNEPVAVAIGDLLGNALLDLAVVDREDDSVIVLPGVGGGYLGRAVTVPIGGMDPDSVVLGDFDMNGFADLATANTGSNDVSVVLGSAGGFGTAMTFAAGTGPVSIASGLFDNDTDLDLVVANPSTNQVHVLIGDGAGGFGTATPVSVGTQPEAVATGLLDGDGLDDLAVANTGSNDVTVLLADGLGGFAAAANSPFAAGTDPSAIAIGSLDAGGTGDIVVANEGSDDVTVLLGDGLGDFTEPAGSPLAVGDGPVSLGIADMNVDGTQDIVVANVNSQDVSVLVGFGDGTFATSVEFPTNSGATSVAIGDLDQDGLPDLAVAEPAIDDVSLLFGVGAGLSFQPSFVSISSADSAAVGDLDLDGILDFATGSNTSTVFAVLGSGGGSFDPPVGYVAGVSYSTSLNIADLSQDGVPDIAFGGDDSHVFVLLGTGGGSLGPPSSFRVGPDEFTSTVPNVELGDMNLDGVLDVVSTYSGQTSNVSILFGTGNGGFATATTVSNGGYIDLGVQDLDLDGLQDLALMHISGIDILLGTGGGSLNSTGSVPLPLGPQSLAIGDVDLDGLPDLAALSFFTTQATVVLGTGDGSFGTAASYETGAGHIGLVIRDFTGDKVPDLACVRGASVSVLPGIGGSTFGTPQVFSPGGSAIALGDLNGDGQVDLVMPGSSNVAVLLHE